MGGPLELGGVVFNMFEDVDVDDGVERLIVIEGLQGSAYVLEGTSPGHVMEIFTELSDKLWIRLETDPPTLRVGAQKLCVRSYTCTYFENVSVEVRGDALRPVGLPVGSRGEEV
jgi:hypothetical protein